MKDVLNTLLNTIIFHRALGVIQIQFSNCEVLKKTTYVSYMRLSPYFLFKMRCGDENIEKEIEQIILKIINDIKAVKPSAESKSENIEVRLK